MKKNLKKGFIIFVILLIITIVGGSINMERQKISQKDCPEQITLNRWNVQEDEAGMEVSRVYLGLYHQY